MIEAPVAAIVGLLSKYVALQATDLVKQFGAEAAKYAEQLFSKVAERLNKKTIERFQKNPERYTAPVQDDLIEQLEQDENFAKELKELYEQFETALQAHKPITSVSLIGDDNVQIAGSGNIVAHRGGVVVSGSNQGNITTGDETNPGERTD